MPANVILAARAANYRRMVRHPRPSAELTERVRVRFVWPDGTECIYWVRYHIADDWHNARPNTPPDQWAEVTAVELLEVDGDEPTPKETVRYGYAALQIGGPMEELQAEVMRAHIGG